MAASLPTVPREEEEGEEAAAGIILPSQYYQGLHGAETDFSERRFMLALLIDAISCLTNNDRRLRAQTKLWFDGCSRATVSFEQVCDVVGLDADAMRTALKKSAIGKRHLASLAHLRRKYRADV